MKRREKKKVQERKVSHVRGVPIEGSCIVMYLYK